MADKKVVSSVVEEGKACAVLSYLFAGIIWFFVDENMRKNSFAKFHVKQALILLSLSIVLFIVVAVVSLLAGILMLIPGVDAIISEIMDVVRMVVWLVYLVLWIIGFFSALSGSVKVLPFVGKYARNITF